MSHSSKWTGTKISETGLKRIKKILDAYKKVYHFVGLDELAKLTGIKEKDLKNILGGY